MPKYVKGNIVVDAVDDESAVAYFQMLEDAELRKAKALEYLTSRGIKKTEK